MRRKTVKFVKHIPVYILLSFVVVLILMPLFLSLIHIFAGAFISICPMLVLYIFGQRYFVEGTATSGLKG